MISRLTFLASLIFCMPLQAGWQGFQRYDFNTKHPWNYEPSSQYVAVLNGQVRWEEVPLISPYVAFGFAHSSACYKTWREAWASITHNHCQWDTWGLVESKCTRDLFVVLPCENQILGMSRDELAEHTREFEDFLSSEGERKASQALNNKYASVALEKVGKIYAAFHERKAFEKQQAFKEQVSQKIGAQFTESMLEIEAKRRLKVAYDAFTTQFLGLTEKNSDLINTWVHFKDIRLPEEKARISDYSSELSTRLSSQSLTWDAFRKNEKMLIETTRILDKDILAWDDITYRMFVYQSTLEVLINSFKSALIDDFWSSSAGDSERDSLLAANYVYFNKIALIQKHARRRSDELREYRKQYISLLQAYQAHYVERIALQEKNLYTESRKELDLKKNFSESVLLLTSSVHEKPAKANELNMPFLYERYLELLKISQQKYICSGDLISWKQDACSIALKNISIAERELEGIKVRTFSLYSKMLVAKAEASKLDTKALQEFLIDQSSLQFTEVLMVYDALLLKVNNIAKSQRVHP